MVTKSPLRFPEARQTLLDGLYVPDDDVRYVVDCILGKGERLADGEDVDVRYVVDCIREVIVE